MMTLSGRLKYIQHIENITRFCIDFQIYVLHYDIVGFTFRGKTQ